MKRSNHANADGQEPTPAPFDKLRTTPPKEGILRGNTLAVERPEPVQVDFFLDRHLGVGLGLGKFV